MSSVSNEVKKGKTMNLLDSLKRYTTVVADTGDFESIARYKPQDATTNPSLLYQAAQKPQYEHLIEDALRHASRIPGDRAARTEAFMDKLLVNFGCEILKIIPDGSPPKWMRGSASTSRGRWPRPRFDRDVRESGDQS